MKPIDIYLASSSPRRQKLLKQIGVRFDVIDISISEHRLQNESIMDAIQRLALAKAKQGLLANTRKFPCPVLAADTMVVCEDEIFGKPKTVFDAQRMLGKLSGRQHTVITTVALVDETRESVNTSVTKVYFKVLSEEEMLQYCATKEPYDKAGAYAIQGLGALFISRIEGSYSGVMGLPIFETSQLLLQFGIPVLKSIV